MTTMAGVPRMAGTAWVPAHLVTSPDAYVSQVMDDGMLGAGVHEGDLVLVDPDRAPEDGNIVVAMVTWNNARCRVIRYGPTHAITSSRRRG